MYCIYIKILGIHFKSPYALNEELNLVYSTFIATLYDLLLSELLPCVDVRILGLLEVLFQHLQLVAVKRCPSSSHL
jgi:hypothetical protein